MATIPIYSSVDKSWINHIKVDHTNWDGRCPLEDELEEINKKGVIDPNSEHMSWLLSQILDRPELTGTREVVRNRRAVIRMQDYVYNSGDEPWVIFTGGSRGDGFVMMGGDVDAMFTLTYVIVTDPDYQHTLPEDNRHKTVLNKREADCQPGYVALELRHLGQR